jgi:hypothetical protein
MEQKDAKQRRYSDSNREQAGLLGTAPDPRPSSPLSLSPAAAAAAADAADAAAAAKESEGLLPVMLENGLERLGAL